MSKFLIENLDFRVHLLTFGGENTPKSRPYQAENNAQKFSKQLQNNFGKVQKSTFLTPKMVKNDPSKPPKWANFWPKISIFGVIYQPLELKIHPKVGILRSETMPKQFPNNSKKTSKSPENDFFDLKNGQIWDVNLAKSVNFWVHCRPLSSIFGLLVL